MKLFLALLGTTTFLNTAAASEIQGQDSGIITADTVPPMMSETAVELVSVIIREDDSDGGYILTTEDGSRSLARLTVVDPPDATEDGFRKVARQTAVNLLPAAEDGIHRVVHQNPSPEATQDGFRHPAQETGPSMNKDAFKHGVGKKSSLDVPKDDVEKFREATARLIPKATPLYLHDYVPVSVDGKCGQKVNRTCVDSAFGECCNSRGRCGNGPEYCAALSCQPEYGACYTTTWGTLEQNDSQDISVFIDRIESIEKGMFGKHQHPTTSTLEKRMSQDFLALFERIEIAASAAATEFTPLREFGYAIKSVPEKRVPQHTPILLNRITSVAGNEIPESTSLNQRQYTMTSIFTTYVATVTKVETPDDGSSGRQKWSSSITVTGPHNSEITSVMHNLSALTIGPDSTSSNSYSYANISHFRMSLTSTEIGNLSVSTSLPSNSSIIAADRLTATSVQIISGTTFQTSSSDTPGLTGLPPAATSATAASHKSTSNAPKFAMVDISGVVMMAGFGLIGIGGLTLFV